MTGRRVVLWRHGQTAWNLAERFQGSSDVELDEVGVAQAGRAARLLTTLARGVVQTFSHGVARSVPEPHAAQTPTAV